MIFTSGNFFFFFIVFYLIYLFLQGRIRTQNILLLAASYFFYGYWDYRFLSLILISTVVDYFSAHRVEYHKNHNNTKAARYWLWLSILTNLSILGFFKYYNFFIDSFIEFLSLFGLSVAPYTLNIILPVGISFYTFQTMSYTIDVYRGRQKACKSPLNFAIFVSFFPQLMAGPIERAKKLLPQIERVRIISYEDVREGGWLILWGMFKKVYIADNLAPFTHWAFIEGGAVTALDIYLGMLAFSIQFYCDFSGYSNMARGMARLMGIRLSLNFNLPFLASNPSELWRRWHITLSNWFRDYLYAELLKLHNATSRKTIALILTMMLVGLWHGAAWTYIIWGGLWGIAIAIHRKLQAPIANTAKNFIYLDRYMHWAGVLLTFNLWVVFGIFFVSPSLDQALSMSNTMLTRFDFSPDSVSNAIRILFYSFPIIIMQAIQYKQRRLDILKSASASVRFTLYVLLLLLLWTNGSQHLNEFIYFQF